MNFPGFTDVSGLFVILVIPTSPESDCLLFKGYIVVKKHGVYQKLAGLK